MDESIKILPNFKKFNSYIDDVKQGISPIMLSGLTDVAKIHFAYSTFFYIEKPICIVTYNELQAKKIIKDLQYFTRKVEYFPRREILSYDYLAESKDISNERINCLNNIYSKKAKIIVTTIEAASQKIVTKNELYKNIVEIKENSIIELEELKKKLFYLGYERRDLVENAGEYSIRGGIIDIGITKETGIRIELWGDEVDSIREFNIMSQRSTEKVKTAKIYPATEFVLERNIEEVISDILNDFDEEKVAEDIEEIKNGNYLSKVDKYFNYFYKNSETIIDYIKENYIIFLDEISKIKARSENIIKDNQNVIKSLMEKKRAVPQALTNLNNYIDFLGLIKNIQIIYLEKQDIGFVDKQSMHAKRNGYSFSYREVNFFRSSMDLLFEEVQEAAGNKTVVILCANKENVSKMENLLKENVPISEKYLNNVSIENKIIITQGFLSSGFECYDFNLLVISAYEIFSTPQKRRRVASEFKQGETVIFSELKPGDYIVHKTNGIGEFVGVSTIKTGNVTKDYIKLKYKGDDVLYIPTNSLDNIRKYIGTGNSKPKVNKLRKQRVVSN